jgi:hypothetical protein
MNAKLYIKAKPKFYLWRVFKKSFFVFQFLIVTNLFADNADIAASPKFIKPNQKELAAIKKAALKSLKDPDSAKFNNEVTIINYKYACIGVNAKNAFGGYVGFHQITLFKHETIGWSAIGTFETNHDQCIDNMHQFSLINK